MKTASVFLFVMLLCFMTAATRPPDILVHHLTCNYTTNPLGIDTPNLSLSWQLKSDRRNQYQTAYQILVADTPERLKKKNGNIWDSTKVMSDESLQIPYKGAALTSAKKYYWKVRVWNQDGKVSAWSEPAIWQMGLLNARDWQDARWIGMEDLTDSLKVIPGVHGSGDNLGAKAVRRPVLPLLRKEFSVQKSIASASLFISGLGQYEASINGTKIGQAFLSPGWTYFEKTCLYNTFDVTKSLKKGTNAIGVILGNGFYNINRERYRKLVVAFGMPKVICLLLITYADGSTETLSSGPDWTCSPSPLTYTSIYGGEDYDARLEQSGWDTPGFNDAPWTKALLVEEPKGRLIAEADYPLEVKEILHVKKIDKTGSGKYLYDFGQNASGIIELTVRGKKGQVVKLVPGELITAAKEINQRASGEPYYFSYILKGDGIETWRPRFSYYGFRYVAVEGAAPDTAQGEFPRIIDLKFLHTRNASPQAGSFHSSSSLLNQINDLIRWAIKSNLQSVVTDCPHREKLGWLEQTHLMGASMHYNYSLYHLYRQLILDMIDAQTSTGLVPDIAPEYVPFVGGFRDSPEWGSACVLLPWMVYQWYGDQNMINMAWPMMTSYVEYLGTKADGHILSHGLGDWFDLGPGYLGPAQLTPKELTATAIYYEDITLLARMAEISCRVDEIERWSVLAVEVKNAFNKTFFNEQSKVYSTGSQTAMSMPLCLGLVDEQDREAVLKNLVDSIRTSNAVLTAGDVGFHYLVQALEEGGASQLLYEMNSRNDVPGYGFQLKKGATALTESWAALEDVSNNHLMLGHLMEWFYAGLGGIKQEPASVGWKNITIQPEVVGDLTNVNAAYESPRGLIRTDWKKVGSSFELSVEIPMNTTAMVYLPTLDDQSIKESGHPIQSVEDIQLLRRESGRSVYRIGSGFYRFSVQLSN
jgi:alpha-L-rhamnosidase